MKKFLMCLIVLTLLSGLIFSYGLQVKIPDASTTWYKGGEYQIVWTSDGCQTSRFKIRLFKDSISQSNLKEMKVTDDNKTSWEWKVSNSLETGKYIIRVKTYENLCVGNSKVFWIKDNLSVGTGLAQGMIKKIKIIAPNYTSAWKEGTSNIIKWKDPNTVKQTMKIRLFNEKNQYIYEIKTVLASNVKKISVGRARSDNISKINWVIPKNKFTIPGFFKIKMISVTGSVLGESDKFRILGETDKWDFGD
ncbi:MAG: hypothetical protein ABFR75_14470 [Acidobacteriota bacterium]